MSALKCWLVSELSMQHLAGAGHAGGEVPAEWMQWHAGALRRITVVPRIDTQTQTVERIGAWLATVEADYLTPVVVLGPDEQLPDMGAFNAEGAPWSDALELAYVDAATDAHGAADLARTLKHPDADFMLGWSGFVGGTNPSAHFPTVESEAVAAAFAVGVRAWISDCRSKELDDLVGFADADWKQRPLAFDAFKAPRPHREGQPFFALKNYPHFGLVKGGAEHWRLVGPLPSSLQVLDPAGTLRDRLNAALHPDPSPGRWLKVFLEQIEQFVSVHLAPEVVGASPRDDVPPPESWSIQEYLGEPGRRGWELHIRAPRKHELPKGPKASLQFPLESRAGVIDVQALKLHFMYRGRGARDVKTLIFYLSLDDAIAGFDSPSTARIVCRRFPSAGKTYWGFDLPSRLFQHTRDDDEVLGIQVEPVRRGR